ncbi:hypothetical protein BDR26DRAFT_848533 [Obelidium mucronatum]|nr:hypothetical protein BDR26DRAFT_848533 [Obelidium mucronatum]
MTFPIPKSDVATESPKPITQDLVSKLKFEQESLASLIVPVSLPSVKMPVDLQITPVSSPKVQKLCAVSPKPQIAPAVDIPHKKNIDVVPLSITPQAVAHSKSNTSKHEGISSNWRKNRPLLATTSGICDYADRRQAGRANSKPVPQTLAKKRSIISPPIETDPFAAGSWALMDPDEPIDYAEIIGWYRNVGSK